MRPWTKGPLYIAGIIGAAALFANSAFGAPITGVVNIAGGLTFSASTINFTPSTFTVIPVGNTGDFAGLDNTLGTVMNLNVATQPVGVVFPALADFVTFAAAPNIHLDLNMIAAGDFTNTDCTLPPAAGQTCTPSGLGGILVSPADFVNNRNGTSYAQIALSGISRNTAPGGQDGTWNGTFTAQFSTPYQTVLMDLFNNGSVPTSYSATITATSIIPEPASFILLGCGLIGISALRRLRRS